MFPGPGAQIHRNEAGEVLGWDYPSYDPNDDYDDYAEVDARREAAWERAEDELFQDWEETASPSHDFDPTDHEKEIGERARRILKEWTNSS